MRTMRYRRYRILPKPLKTRPAAMRTMRYRRYRILPKPLKTRPAAMRMCPSKRYYRTIKKKILLNNKIIIRTNKSLDKNKEHQIKKKTLFEDDNPMNVRG